MNARHVIALALGLAALAACTRMRTAGDFTSPLPGDADRGEKLIAANDCGVCHTIPGVARARGHVGPPLTAFAQRAFIAGQVPNQPDTLVRWIQDPPSIAPNTAMPVLGISERDARDIAAYLYTLN